MFRESPIDSFRQQHLLLQIEYDEERQAFRKQADAEGLARRMKRGDAWHPLRIGKTFYNSLNQRCIEVYRNSEEDTEHNFEPGRPVAFFTITVGDEKKPQQHLRFFNLTGTVSFVDGDRMVIAVPDSAQLTDITGSANVGIQLSFDETSYRAMFVALERVIKAKNNRLSYLRDLFYSQQMKPEQFSFAPMRFSYLNATQEMAVNEVLRSKDVHIVHGPPGTGKTTTLVEAIYETLMRESQVLVCAQSNMAVDWISEKLIDRGVNVLRIGNPTRVNDKMLSFTYERRFEAHPEYPDLWQLRKTIREMRNNRKRGDNGFHQKIERLKSRAAEIEIRINAELFGESRVIASTLVGSSHRLLHGMHFSTLFIDEAAQALEAACWIPIRRVSRVVLAGDHCQLPPTIKSLAALHGGLDKTLMQRIAANHPETVTLLRVQYRMNEQIMRFSSEWFYGGKIESAPSVRFRGILDYDNPIVWIDSATVLPDSNEEQSDTEKSSRPYHEEFVGESFGRINKPEAELTLSALQQLFEKIGRARILEENIDVGIISPYRAQVQYLRQLIKCRDFYKPYRRLITVNTVDGFQGQERDIIIISLVRSNEQGQIGFLNDLRRMNVAITRARMKLIIIGDVATLTRHRFYRRLYEYIEEVGKDFVCSV